MTPLELEHKQQLSALSFNDQAFQLDGESYFILSGEMHYFRIDADLWPKHLQRIKEAGLNTVSSYVPWSLHEQIKGAPDFQGRYAPNLNLERFIELCKEADLKLILKPGPYILAELAMHGIPRWFFEDYPDALACDVNGKPYQIRYTCLSHPDYKREAMRWYDAVMPLIAANQMSNNGPIAMIQVCNEVGLFQWLGGAGDYSSTSLQDYRNYLNEIYGNIDKLNAHYKTDYSNWNQVSPPSGQAAAKADYFGYCDWENYHRSFYVKYIGWLIDEIRSRGIETPLFHNVPGWVYGRAKNMPVCLSMYHQLSRLYPDIMLSIDHIPENPSYRNFHDDRIINEFTKALKGGRGPLYVAELQAGTREANVRVYPAEMELFYKACLANGIVSMNYYMFSQGRNPLGWSVYDSSFYLQTPLDINGKPGESYPATKHIGRLIETHGKKLCDSQSKTSQALIFYPPYYYREFIHPLFTGENLTNPAQVGCRLDSRMVTDELLFDGLGRLLAMDNQEFDAVDITNIQQGQLNVYKQIWVASTEQMDEDSQLILLEYVRSGGHLICFPTLPKFNLNIKPCTVLADGLGVKTDQILDDFDAMIQWTDTGQEIHAISYIETFKTENACVIARASNGKPCCIRVNCGKGCATVLGTGFVYQAAAHRQAWQHLSLDGDFHSPIACDNPLIITRTRFHKDDGGYFFMLNYHNQLLQGKISTYISDDLIPDGGQFYLPPFTGLMLPFNLLLSKDCTLTTTTSEISHIEITDRRISLELNGHKSTPGQMSLNTTRTVKDILLNDFPVPFEQSSRMVHLQYTHSHTPGKLTIHLLGNVMLSLDQ